MIQKETETERERERDGGRAGGWYPYCYSQVIVVFKVRCNK